MASVIFWNLSELKLEVFRSLHNDRCWRELARCARVHSKWTNLALDELWRADVYLMAKSLASIPRARRQYYASRMATLDLRMSYNDSIHSYDDSIHSSVDGLKFPKLKKVTFDNCSRDEYQRYRLADYIQSTLETLSVEDRAYSDAKIGPLLLSDVADRCRNLKTIKFSVPGWDIAPKDLARLFESVYPGYVYFASNYDGVITYDVLQALSRNPNLKYLILESVVGHDENSDYADGGFSQLRNCIIGANDLKRVAESTTAPFPVMEELRLKVYSDAVPWVTKCFGAVTKLEIAIFASSNEPCLQHVSSLSQLRELSIITPGGSGERLLEHDFIALSSLHKLSTLKIGGSFYPTTTNWSQRDSEAMFSGLPSLEHVEIFFGRDTVPDSIISAISRFCPRLRFISLIGRIKESRFLELEAPLFPNLKSMEVSGFVSGLAIDEVVRMLNDIAPALEVLRCPNEHQHTQRICHAFEVFRNPARVAQRMERHLSERAKIPDASKITP
ncbi:hypothetical protein E4T38_08810 [Aureobasidium subglaciale]|nr:hypothetical protein E4T38_08810 [Aureobasidium subglaciale]KAI5214889.1 hypothetical protein E4T40_08767 [Aureobasidium subglaciale]KAI5217872.1 hypothetical protein E4T41_08677 [Aureobasidium subglaciale]KAI5255428.1 hypothetical protein E4T46_08711 [Aureobasidium subglaciale]